MAGYSDQIFELKKQGYNDDTIRRLMANNNMRSTEGFGDVDPAYFDKSSSGIEWDLSNYNPDQNAFNQSLNQQVSATAQPYAMADTRASLDNLYANSAGLSVDTPATVPGTAPESTTSSFFSDDNNDNRWNILDTNQQALPFSSDAMTATGISPTQANEMAQANSLVNKTNQAGQFDYTGAANLGLSAFSTWNNYNMQNEQMDLYKKDLNKKWADQDRRNATRANWSSAFQQA